MTLLGLIEAVSDGTDKNATVTAAREAFPDLSIRRDVLKACDGSLDAAQALHDALLPGWKWRIEARAAVVCRMKDEFTRAGCAKNPARAWLIAILRALEGEGK
jgi:hypothetical protein